MPLGYDASLFVTPPEVGQYVHTKIKNWRTRQASGGARTHIVGLRVPTPQAPGDLVLSLAGERGIGKTWLLCHLTAEYQHVQPVVYLNLEERYAYASVDAYVGEASAEVAQVCGDGPALLLLDHVPPHLDEHLRALEDAILRPHLAHRRSLVIMALMHPTQLCWRAPELRGGEWLSMPRFGQAQTRMQWRWLERAGRAHPLAEEALRLSDGLPLLNYLLATYPRVDAFEMLLDYWLERVPAADREVVRGCLEAVCQLPYLELAGIQRMLDVYDRHCRPPAGQMVSARGVPNLLRKYWLARPAVKAPGRIVLVDSVQRAVREVMRARNATLLAMLTKAATAGAGGEEWRWS